MIIYFGTISNDFNLNINKITQEEIQKPEFQKEHKKAAEEEEIEKKRKTKN